MNVILIACLWACNQNVDREALVTGKLDNYKGEKVYFEVYGQDSLVKVPLDTAGRFAALLKLGEPSYVRLMNGKAAFPLYLKPGMKVELALDVKKIQEEDYESVVFPGGVNKETRMMAYYYANQWFPSTQEMFVYPPAEFRDMMDSVVRYNDALVDGFLAKDDENYDPEFVRIFKLQIKVPFAASYFYYPMYHSLLNPKDTAEVPEDFNFFDEWLPKNDSVVYNKVYRYKTYEVSYWNNRIAAGLMELSGDPATFFAAYLDQLLTLELLPQIKEDVAYTFIMGQAQGAGAEVKELLRARCKEVISDPRHLRQIEDLCSRQ